MFTVDCTTVMALLCLPCATVLVWIYIISRLREHTNVLSSPSISTLPPLQTLLRAAVKVIFLKPQTNQVVPSRFWVQSKYLGVACVSGTYCCITKHSKSNSLLQQWLIISYDFVGWLGGSSVGLSWAHEQSDAGWKSCMVHKALFSRVPSTWCRLRWSTSVLLLTSHPLVD